MKVLSIFHDCGLLGYLIANMCVCMWKANVRKQNGQSIETNNIRYTRHMMKTANKHKYGGYPIKWSVCLSQAMTWIFNVIYRDLLVFSELS